MEAFVISPGVKTEAEVVVVEIVDGAHLGGGESVRYGRYRETVSGVLQEIASARARIEAGPGRTELQALLPPGAPRNAIDCEPWDLAAKRQACAPGRWPAALASIR